MHKDFSASLLFIVLINYLLFALLLEHLNYFYNQITKLSIILHKN